MFIIWMSSKKKLIRKVDILDLTEMVTGEELERTAEQVVIALIGGVAAGILVQVPVESNRVLAVLMAMVMGISLILAGFAALVATRLICSDEPKKENAGAAIGTMLLALAVGLVFLGEAIDMTRFAT